MSSVHERVEYLLGRKFNGSLRVGKEAFDEEDSFSDLWGMVMRDINIFRYQITRDCPLDVKNDIIVVLYVLYPTSK